MIQELKYQHDKNEKLKYNIRIISRSFVIAVVVLVLLLFTYLIIYFGDQFLGVKTGKNKMPMFGAYVIVSPSMIPTIKVNDAIIVKRDNNDKYIVGDIISFYSTEYDSRGMVITHRIINKDKKSNNTSLYTTKGDNNSIADKNSVNTDNVYGKVLFILPKIGFIKNFLSKPINIILCILIPSSFIIVVDLGHISILFKKNTKVV